MQRPLQLCQPNRKLGIEQLPCVNRSHVTMQNLVSPSIVESPNDDEQSISLTKFNRYSALVFEDILNDIFSEGQGQFTETCNSDLLYCKSEEIKPEKDSHVDKRLRYWREVLQKRRKLQERVQSHANKTPDEVLFNRHVTLDHRNEQTVKRLLDYADRMKPDKLASRVKTQLKAYMDANTCECIEEVNETLPKAERKGIKNVEIIGLPNVSKCEILGSEAAGKELPRGWLQSKVLDKSLQKRFYDIHNVLEFFPDLDRLEVVGKSIDKIKKQGTVAIKDGPSMHTISTSSDKISMEECVYEDWPDLGTVDPELINKVPDVALCVNGSVFVAGDPCLSDCYEIGTKFSCDPFQRQAKHILQLTNVGKETLTFTWKQGVYYYNRGSLLLAEDNEFLFDTEGFRLTQGETYNLIVLYQPRKVNVAVEMWMLNVNPRIFCGSQESLVLRFHGICTPPSDYMAKIKELNRTLLTNLSTVEMNQVTGQLASIAPFVTAPPACCPFDRSLDEREIFNALNKGYTCTRFDDLEVLKGMHKQLKKPREPKWDFRLETIKEFILRLHRLEDREEMFSAFATLLSSLLGSGPSLDKTCQLSDQKQRTRYIYVRGVISNGIEEWEDLMCSIEESFFKPELQRYYMKLIHQGIESNEMTEVEEEDGYSNEDFQPKFLQIDQGKILELLSTGNVNQEKAISDVMRKLNHSKYFRDTLYIQTYTHLCNISENIVSVIESTEFVPN